ncbi:serine/threonine protein kinase [Coriobacteriia bacterium Es71-Z0120]|uniref:serine/threonine-protein kinase n=1 Tax=Parvivirga hydrogeniphila TaxID=2939460 RepID=UPI002260BA04|nr:serine/threonine-protein kinase [Parvivirga hydrogeniphila]MCL4078260.1 serine/threonine protein kinase [Parvivirga hydrogeniphila]
MDEPLILDRYRPLASLGEGGHASVVLAFDTKMARRVAVKRFSLSGGGGRRGALGLAEARTAAMLNHPAIVTVHEWEPTQDGAVIVMEHVDGASLAEVLDELDGPLDLDEAAAVVQAVADAVAFAHANGVLHLDLKPENVLVDRRGLVKVADFGIAALTGADRAGRARGGTPGYMAPEQIRDEPVDERTDEWALAALAYELVTGIAPFDAETPERSLVRIESGRVEPPSRIARGLPSGVDLVLARALAPDPADRYPGVAAFATALLDHLGDPRAGRESLAEIVEDIVADEDLATARSGAWGLLGVRAAWLARSAAAAACAWAGWVGAAPVGGTAGAAAAAGLCAVAAAISPPLGLAIALLALAVGAGAAFGLAAGAIAGALAAAWWFGVARIWPEAGFAPAVSPALAAVRAGAAAPLVLGLLAEPAPAALGGAAAGAVTALASALSANPPSAASVPLGFFADPWRTLDPGRIAGLDLRLLAALTASWGIAALAASLGARRNTRGGALAGGLAGLVLMGASLFALSPQVLAACAIDLAVAGAAVVLAARLFAPPRA